MEKINLENLRDRIENGELTYDEATNVIMKEVYTHKGLFGLTRLTEDELQSYMLHQRDNFEQLLHSYDRTSGSFFTYLMKTIERSTKTWKKRCIRNRIFENEITVSDQLLYEEMQGRYLEPEEEYIKKEEEVLAVNEPLPEDKITLKNKPWDKTKNRKFDDQKAFILILALKASYSMNEELIKKVSQKTGISEEELTDYINQINETLENKINRREACLRCRDNAYYFHRKYQNEATHLLDGTNWADTINQKYKKQTKTWIDKNRRLSLKQYSVSATNISIGKILGMSPRHVSYVLRKGLDNVDNNSLKEYHDDYENNVSHRQYE